MPQRCDSKMNVEREVVKSLKKTEVENRLKYSVDL